MLTKPMTLQEFANELYPTISRRAAYDRARRLLHYLPDQAVISIRRKVLLRRPVVEKWLMGEFAHKDGASK
jgi:hypothetical protein